MYYLVLNNEFNRRHCPSLIGKRFVNPPVGARVRKLPVRSRRPSGTTARGTGHA